MDIVAISDTHGYDLDTIDMPDGDLLLHAGDFTGRGELGYIQKFSEQVNDYDYDNTIVIAGNHDFCFKNDLEVRAKEIIEENCIYLQDSSVTINGYKIYGTPWSSQFGSWAFMDVEEKLYVKYKKIPDDTDIILSHGPPYGINDKVARTPADGDRHVGSKELKNRVERIEPEAVVYGHIHEAHGRETVDEIKYINASICNLDYDPANDPIKFTV